MTSTLAAALLFFLAAAHSVLGERHILSPLFAADWKAERMPRFVIERLLRMVWHGASVAWVGLGALALGAPAALVVSATSFATGALLFVMLRGHFAWVLFFLAAAASLHAAGVLGTPALSALALAASALAMFLAIAHVVWAFRGAPAGVLPQLDSGRLAISPGPIACLVVAALLATFAVLLAWPIFGAGFEPTVRWLTLAGCGVLALRALGDGRFVGFSKRERGTLFARRDDAYYTPLVVLLAAGAYAATWLA
ncbi:MAG: DUF3995 domain-containing protein [Myxococcota bacterium]